ncbi:MAG TPA: hypothetical protein VLF71_04995 [Candidatus Saccharimonadales bacterium]|nr:hypothetical protein [Candidatus Saccharimonadales bacterium]
MKQIDPRLIEEYRNPLAFLEWQAYRSLRHTIVTRAVTIIFVGVAFFVLAILPAGNLHSPAMAKGQLATTLLGAGLPLLGFYQLFRVKHTIIATRRAQLVWLNPELQPLAPAKKIKQLPPLRKRFFWDSLLVGGIVLAITAWALYLADH